MFIYKVNKRINKFGFYNIPKNCVNAEFGHFEELLKTDSCKLVKSAICNWFSDTHNNRDFSIGMNGIDSIIIFDEKGNEYDYYFHDFNATWRGYLLHYTNSYEYFQTKTLYERRVKLDIIKDKIIKNNI